MRRQNANAPEVVEDVGYWQSQDFLQRTIAKLPTNSQRTIERLKRVKAKYIPCGRDDYLAVGFDSFLVEILTPNENGVRDEGRIFFITGESGAGKTRAVKYMLANVEAVQPEQTAYGLIKRVISVSLKGNCTLGILGEEILRRAGYPVEDGSIKPSQLWNSLSRRLGQRGVLIVHIDETQHLIKNTEKASDRKALANALKGVMNDDYWPVSFVVSGLPIVNSLAKMDEQFERRGYFRSLPRLNMVDPEERQLVHNILDDMAETAEIDCNALLETDVPERIAHAAARGYGRVTQVVRAALQDAMQSADTVLTRENFVRAYLLHSSAQGRDERNPFLEDNWRLLPEGSFIIDDEDEEDE
jgi:hypothetical protein